MAQRNPQSAIRNPQSAADLLFEIGTEELPAAYLPDLIAQLNTEAEALFAAAHIGIGSLQAFGTPRRLVLWARGVEALQRKPAEEIRGPSKQAAFDAAGQPTPALAGFLRSRNGRADQVRIAATDKGEYVYLDLPSATTPTTKLLPDLLAQLVRRLRAPKSMRWDASGLRFARPIRWVAALFGTSAVPVRLGRLTAQPQTWLGRPLRPKAVALRSVPDYFAALKRAGVLLDPLQRRETIRRQVAAAAQRAQGQPAPEMLTHGLLEEVTFLVERPTPFLGAFDETYLELPREVLLASMAKHQRVFAVDGLRRAEGGSGLRPRFVGIMDGRPGRPDAVRRVVERILNARLADSLFFLAEDRKRLPLERLAADLAGVTFHERLGSMADKTVRLRGLSEPLAEAWRLTEEERAHLRRACQLAKADLVTTMVREFPTLQGVIGKYYARESGEPAPVADALEEQYLPTGERVPATLIGSALALLDKYDTLTGYFALGIEPTGDQDPFGLRRAAQGIVEVAWAVHRPLPLDALLHARGTMPPFGGNAPKQVAATGERVTRYLFERLYTFAWPTPPPTPDCIDAVLGSGAEDLVDAMDRIRSLQQLAGHPGLLKAAKVIERTRNILKGAPLRQPQVDPDRLQDPLEQRLWQVYAAQQPAIAGLIRERAYSDATTRFGEVFYEPLHAFFERVLVNVKEESLQQNRLALMKAINTLYTERIADLSKLTILQREEIPS
jgi:glycyl-tRNA synthetase beta chain